MEISGTTDTATVQLTLRREGPVLTTADPASSPPRGWTDSTRRSESTSGTPTVGSATHHISGRPRFDRQLRTPDGEPSRVTWLGPDLKGPAPERLAPPGMAPWITELKDDADTLTHFQHTDHGSGDWKLTVPSLDAPLTAADCRLPRRSLRPVRHVRTTRRSRPRLHRRLRVNRASTWEWPRPSSVRPPGGRSQPSSAVSASGCSKRAEWRRRDFPRGARKAAPWHTSMVATASLR